MLSSDKNIETLSQLIEETKRYVELRGKCWRISLVSKVSTLASALVLAVILFMLASAVVIFLSFTMASTLALWVGTVWGYALVTAFYFLVGVVIFINRRKWIEAPVVDFIASVMLSDDGDE